MADLISPFEARRVERLLASLHSGRVRPGEAVRVLGATHESGWVSMRWELADARRTQVYPVEARVQLQGHRMREREAVELLYDLLGARFDEHLDDDRQPFTGPEWEELEFAGQRVFLRGQMLGEAAEAAGSALLGADAVARSRALRIAAATQDDAAPDSADAEESQGSQEV